MAAYETLIGQLERDAQAAAAAAAAAARELDLAVAAIDSRREAERVRDRAAAAAEDARRRHALELETVRLQVHLADRALSVADLAAAVGEALDAALQDARSAAVPVRHGPLSELKPLRLQVQRVGMRRDAWASDRAALALRLAELERAG